MSEDEKTDEKQGLWQNKPFRMVLALVSIMVVSTLVLQVANLATEDIIAQNQAIVLQTGVLTVLGYLEPDPDTDVETNDLEQLYKAHVDERFFPQDDGSVFPVWIGKDAGGQLSGYVVRLRGGGFQGIIDVVIGLTPDLQLDYTTGFELIESGETPGLGDEMRMWEFRSQWYDSPATDPDEGIETVPNIDFIKYQPPQVPNQFQAITGATFTSNAIRDMLNRALATARPLKEAGELEVE